MIYNIEILFETMQSKFRVEIKSHDMTIHQHGSVSLQKTSGGCNSPLHSKRKYPHKHTPTYSFYTYLVIFLVIWGKGLFVTIFRKNRKCTFALSSMCQHYNHASAQTNISALVFFTLMKKKHYLHDSVQFVSHFKRKFCCEVIINATYTNLHISELLTQFEYCIIFRNAMQTQTRQHTISACPSI